MSLLCVGNFLQLVAENFWRWEKRIRKGRKDNYWRQGVVQLLADIQRMVERSTTPDATIHTANIANFCSLEFMSTLARHDMTLRRTTTSWVDKIANISGQKGLPMASIYNLYMGLYDLGFGAIVHNHPRHCCTATLLKHQYHRMQRSKTDAQELFRPRHYCS